MSTEKKAAKKKAAKKPSIKAAMAAPAKPKKAAPVEIPPNPTRPYGTTVYTKRTTSKAEAARLVGDCEFRLQNAGPDGFRLYADKTAYDRMKAAK